MAQKKLTDKQQRYAEEYCVDFNKTQAAIRAGYSEKTAKEQGYRLFTNVHIRAYIKKRLDELAMSSEEALKRLSDIAAGNVGHFLTANEEGQIFINLGSEDAKANYNLLRKVKQIKTVTRGDNEYEREETRTEFEIYDSKSALVDILKIHGKFVEKMDVTSGGEKLPTSVIFRVPEDGTDSGRNPTPDDS